MDNITQIEQTIFDKIILISKTIAKIYERMLDEELMDYKGSCVYKSFLNNLKALIEEEQKLYSSLNLDYSKKDNLLKYLINNNKLDNVNITNMFTDACNKETKELCIYRISNKLEEYASLSGDLIEELNSNDLMLDSEQLTKF